METPQVVPPAISLIQQERELFDVLLRTIKEGNLTTTLRVAGGWVRDKILGRENHDIDIAVDNMTGAQFAHLVNANLTQHGVPTKDVAVIAANPEQSKHLETARAKFLGIEVDLVNLRAETYADSRIPTVRMGTPLEDAQRRDLTINSLFYNINTGQVEDQTGMGLADLRAGLIRTPLPPMQTLLDDPLRALRAIRFAARFGFPMAEELRAALCDSRVKDALLTKISRERVGAELTGILEGPAPVLGFHHILDNGLADVVFVLPQGRLWSEAERRFGLRVAELIDPMTPRLAQPDTWVRSSVLLAALLSPFASQTFPAHKGRQLPVGRDVVRERLQLRAREADLVAHLHTDAIRLAGIVTGCATGPFERVPVGMALRAMGEHWHHALDLARCMEVAQLETGMVVLPPGAPGRPLEGLMSPAEAPAQRAPCVAQYEAFAQRVAAEGLGHVYDLKHLLDGQRLCQELAIGPGRAVGELLEREMEWQIAHPGEDEAAFRAWLQDEGAQLVGRARQQQPPRRTTKPMTVDRG
ncbi:putative CCA tRNA nucleotidyltransferase [Paratrimastix pyriformis]|uniref:CCA tRNA nucleotidyltransferase n=1 Tax=Paratrimastix pyriformis TaxID=342808 RepID=A0ABQ8UP47_9EUKA|nr:putative CCA tRNA nucleotidyltransferase [Paratrimastix pyriformis]